MIFVRWACLIFATMIAMSLFTTWGVGFFHQFVRVIAGSHHSYLPFIVLTLIIRMRGCGRMWANIVNRALDWEIWGVFRLLLDALRSRLFLPFQWVFIFLEDRVIFYWKILETHKVLGSRSFLRVDGEASSNEVKILPLKLRHSLLEVHLLFYDRNLKDNIYKWRLTFPYAANSGFEWKADI